MGGSRILRVAGLLALAAVASGCWLQQGFGPGRQGYSALETEVTAANVADLATAWTATVDGAAGEAVIFSGRAFVSDGGSLTALRLATGAEDWSGAVGGSTPAVVDGQLRVAAGGADRCHMLSVAPATGATTELAAFGPELPGFAGGCGPGGDVVGVGSQAVASWSVFVGPVPAGPPGPCNRGQSFVLAGPGVSSVDTATAAVWDHDESEGICVTGGVLPPIPTFGPISSDGTSILFTEGLTLDALPVDCTAAGCPTTWSVDLAPFVAAGSTIAGPAVALAGGDIAVASSDGTVVVVDGASHQVAWTADVGAALDQPLAASPTTIFAASADGTISALPAGGCGSATCTPEWTATLPGGAASARPSIGGDVLYVGGADGTVTALPAGGCGAATCTALWTGTTPAQVTGAPAIFSGTVVVGSDDGTVTAFALPTP
jgi:hypothetical protein